MSIYFLIVSAVLGLLLLGIKVWELGRGRPTFFTRLLAKGDWIVAAVVVWWKETFDSHKEKTILFVLVHLPSYIEKFVADMKRRSHDKYHSLGTKMRGTRPFSPGPSSRGASPFIRNISRDTMMRDEEGM
jgi:hypothetical protein